MVEHMYYNTNSVRKTLFSLLNTNTFIEKSHPHTFILEYVTGLYNMHHIYIHVCNIGNYKLELMAHICLIIQFKSYICTKILIILNNHKIKKIVSVLIFHFITNFLMQQQFVTNYIINGSDIDNIFM